MANKIFSVSKNITKKRISIYILGIKISLKIKPKLRDIIHEETSFAAAREIYSAISVSKAHTKLFTNYENMYYGKELSIFGCGPSIRYYNNELNTINIALNDAIFFDKFKFSYLFNWDTGVLYRNPNWYEDVNKFECKKFYGHCINPEVINPAKKESDKENNIYHFYYSSRHGLPAQDFSRIIYPDISTYPLMDFGSISFGALHFAAWTHPKKIYLIGLDTANLGHALGENYKCNYHLSLMLDGYKRFKEFMQIHYPDTEVISVNPVGLKGMFKDVYTKSYINDHPELMGINPEIL